MNNLIHKIKNRDELTKEELSHLLALDDFSEIFRLADDIRAILEFSNYCKRKCKYCGLNSTNKNVKRYRMSVDEILETVKTAYDAGYKTIVLQSGEDNYYTAKMIGDIVRQIKKYTSMAVTVSLVMKTTNI